MFRFTRPDRSELELVFWLLIGFPLASIILAPFVFMAMYAPFWAWVVAALVIIVVTAYAHARRRAMRDSSDELKKDE